MTVINVNTDVSVTRSNTVAVAQRQVKWDDFVLLYYALLWATACKILLTRSYWRYWENILFPFLSTGYFNNKFEYLLKFWFTVISTIKPAPKKKSPEPESKWSSILPLYLSSVATEQMNCAPWPTVRVILVNRSMPWRTHREKILSPLPAWRSRSVLGTLPVVAHTHTHTHTRQCASPVSAAAVSLRIIRQRAYRHGFPNLLQSATISTRTLICLTGEWVSEWVGLNVPIKNFRRRVFPVNHMHWYWQRKKNNQETEHTNNTK